VQNWSPNRAAKKDARSHHPARSAAISEHVVVVLAPFAGWARSRRAFENQLGYGSADYLARSASDRRSASVIRTRATSIGRPPATMRSVFAVASPARIRSTSISTVNPCALAPVSRFIAAEPPAEDRSAPSRVRATDLTRKFAKIEHPSLFHKVLGTHNTAEAIFLRRTSELSLLLLREDHVPVIPISFRNGFLAFAPIIAGG
jgi:hypothetical protein